MDPQLEAQIIEDFKKKKFDTAAAKTINYGNIRATYDNVNGVINCYNNQSQLIYSINIAAMGLYGGRRRRRRTRRSRGSKKRRGTRRRHRRSRRHH